MRAPAEKKKARKSTRSKRSKTMPRSEAPKATGRPPLAIDAETVGGMASVGATIEDVAAFLEVSRDTIERRFAALFAKHRAGKKIKLQQAMLRTAIGAPTRSVTDEEGNVTTYLGTAPNPTMQVWLSKQWLGYSEKREVPVDEDGEEVEISTIEVFGRVIKY